MKLFNSSSYGSPSRSHSHVGAEENSSKMNLLAFGALIPAFTLGALGAIFGGTLWGWKGFGIGAGTGILAGYGVSKLPTMKPESTYDLANK